MGVTMATSQVRNRHSLDLSFNGAYVAVQWVHVGTFLGKEFVF